MRWNTSAWDRKGTGVSDATSPSGRPAAASRAAPRAPACAAWAPWDRASAGRAGRPRAEEIPGLTGSVAGSSLELSCNDVQAPQRDDGVGDRAALDQAGEGGKDGETGRPAVDAVRFARAVADDVEAELAVRPLDHAVHLPLRDRDAVHDQLEVVDHGLHLVVAGLLGRQRHVRIVDDPRPGRHAAVEELADHLQRLPDLQHADAEAVVDVAAVEHRHLEVERVVEVVGVGPPDVVADAARPQAGAGPAPVDRVLARDGGDADRAVDPDPVLVDQGLDVVDPRRDHLQQLAAARLEVRWQVQDQAADA